MMIRHKQLVSRVAQVSLSARCSPPCTARTQLQQSQHVYTTYKYRQQMTSLRMHTNRTRHVTLARSYAHRPCRPCYAAPALSGQHPLNTGSASTSCTESVPPAPPGSGRDLTGANRIDFFCSHPHESRLKCLDGSLEAKKCLLPHPWHAASCPGTVGMALVELPPGRWRWQAGQQGADRSHDGLTLLTDLTSCRAREAGHSQLERERARSEVSPPPAAPPLLPCAPPAPRPVSAPRLGMIYSHASGPVL